MAITAGNGHSSHPVISQDRRYATVLAFQSDATDLVAGDVNGSKDVFMIRRPGRPPNTGTPWRQEPTKLVSRGLGGAPANGPSWGAAIDGGFPEPGKKPTYPQCIAFLSDASNLVRGDTNGVTDAFVSRGPGRTIERVSLPGGAQSSAPATAVAVSVDCSHIAYVSGGELHVRHQSRDRRIPLPGVAADPSFATGERDDLVVGARGGVYRIKNAVERPALVAPGGRNPAYNDIKCRVVAYETTDSEGRTQIAFRFLGHAPRSERRRTGPGVACHRLDRDGEVIVSKKWLTLGNGDSTNPSIGNSGYYITFQSDATNLGTNASQGTDDANGATDAYLYTAVRNLTLIQSIVRKGEPLAAGGTNPSASWYGNYVFFDTPRHDDMTSSPSAGGSFIQQIYMRYLGPL